MYQGLAYDIESVMPAALDTGLFVSLCTLQAPSGALTPSGAPTGAYSNIAGLVDIPCMDAPPSTARIQATEVRDLQEILSSGLRHVALDRYYPSIIYSGKDTGWRAMVDGVPYELMGAEPDSQGTQTRLHLKLVSV